MRGFNLRNKRDVVYEFLKRFSNENCSLLLDLCPSPSTLLRVMSRVLDDKLISLVRFVLFEITQLLDSNDKM